MRSIFLYNEIILLDLYIQVVFTIKKIMFLWNTLNCLNMWCHKGLYKFNNYNNKVI